MKTKFPKSFVLLIAAMVIIVALFVTASAKNNELSPQSVSDVSSEYDVSSGDELPMSGYCGENIKWELDESGVLRLEGSGDMYDFIGEGYTGQCGDYCYGYYPADSSSSTTRNETTTVPYSYYPTTRPYSENTTYYPATTTAPYSQEYTTNPYSDETTYYYGTTTAPATTARQETTTYPQYSTTNHYQEPTSGYSESTTVYYGTTTAPTTTARQETTTYPQSSTTTYYQEPTSGYSESTTIYYGTTTAQYETTTFSQPSLNTTYSQESTSKAPVTTKRYPTTTSPYYPDLEHTTSHNSGDWTYGKIYRWNLHFDEIKEVIIGEGITSVGYSAFANCTNLKSVTLPSTLTSIDSYAFKMCISLEEISVPDSVEAIGNEAFYGCLNLKKITLGNGIKSIAYGAFKETGYYINEDNWVNSVLYIDNCLIEAKDDISGEYSVKDGTIVLADNAFGYCRMLTSVTIPDSVTSIGDSAFEFCTGLTSITIPDSITSIGDCAFYNCTGLTSVTIGNGVTSIDDRAFFNCTGLTSVTIGDGVTSIGDSAFYSCDRLTSITIPDRVTSIGYSAFSYCTGLTSVSIPDSVTSIGYSAFSYCTGLTNVTVDGNNPNYSSDESGVLFNKDKTELIQYPVGNIRTEYIIPNSVTSIGDRAFYNCDRLTSITIPDSVTSIGDCALYNCTGLTNVTVDGNNPNYSSDESGVLFNKDKTELIQYPVGNIRTEYIIPNSVTSIGDRAFYNCDRLTSITIPDSVTSIGRYAFSYCTGLTSITIPDSITSIGDCAFYNCTGLTSITIPDSVTSIGRYAFECCTGLTSVTIGNGVTSIGYSAFSYCTGLTSITISDSVTSIGNYAFENCTGLTSITIPDSVTSIGNYAFENCTGLTSITIPDSVTSIGGGAFSYCTGLTSVTIPDSVTSIGNNAFEYCTRLTSITVDENNPNFLSDESRVVFNKDKTKLIQYPVGNARTEYIIPDSVEIIDSFAFSSCNSLSNVTIPKSICSVNWYAFSDCYNLNTVYYSGSPSMWNSIYFDDGNDDLINATIIFAEENPPEPATIVDEGTNVSVDYDAGKVEGEVGLSVEQNFDSKAFDIISTELEINDNVIYDIKMTVDGVETQPSGTVTVRIPLPEGYDPTKTFVYHVNTQIGTVERMNAVYEDGYLVFETDHFSYYAVVELKDDEPVEKRFKVTWNSNGVVAENEYKEGERITVPQNPTKEGYVFVGWSPSVPEFMPANNLEFFAVFEKTPETNTVTWIVDGRATTANYNVGDAIVIPANPSKSGYRFVRWSPSVPSTMPAYDLTFTAVFEAVVPPTVPAGIVKPSTSSVDYGDSIILHAQIDGALPEGAYIVWSGSNGNFDMSVSDDGMTCKISPRANGKTTLTITVYDKDGKVISSGIQVMTANAGLWQRIVAIFKNIFGLTKTIPQIFKGVF